MLCRTFALGLLVLVALGGVGCSTCHKGHTSGCCPAPCPPPAAAGFVPAAPPAPCPTCPNP